MAYQPDRHRMTSTRVLRKPRRSSQWPRHNIFNPAISQTMRDRAKLIRHYKITVHYISFHKRHRSIGFVHCAMLRCLNGTTCANGC